MARRIVRHIGSPKTGTSSLQVLLARSRSDLEAVGCLYPSDREVERAARGAITSGNAIGMAKFLRPDLRHSVSATAWMASFRLLLADPPEACNQMVYSSEFLWRAHRENLLQLQEVVAAHGFDVMVLAYVRPQDDYALSQYSQLVKRHHERRSFEQTVGSIDMHFLAVLDRYAGVFGSQAMNVRVFDPAQFTGGSLLSDFLAQLDLPTPIEIAAETQVRVNPSLSLQESDTLRFINRFKLNVQVMDQAPVAYRILRRSRHGDEGLALSHDLANRIETTFREENAVIEHRYLKGQHLSFTSPVGERTFPPPGRVFSILVGVLALSIAVRRRLSATWSRRIRKKPGHVAALS